jgi:hypothetical protein
MQNISPARFLTTGTDTTFMSRRKRHDMKTRERGSMQKRKTKTRHLRERHIETPNVIMMDFQSCWRL